MEAFLDFFAGMSAMYKLAWVVACLIFVWILEAVAPLVHHEYNKFRHDGVNLVFFSFSLILNVLIGLATVGLFIWVETGRVGLLSLFEIPIWIKLLLSIMLLDFFAQYVAHYVLHRVKWMWKFHMIHHSDSKVDATTGTRHHPGDYVIREVFAIATVILFGIPVAFYVLYRIVTLFFTYLTHANFDMPAWLDRALSYIFITPHVHKFHHHFERPWTDSNFGNIFSIWDRIFGTFVYDDPHKIKYGLDVLDPARDEDIMYQLQLPVDKTIKTDY